MSKIESITPCENQPEIDGLFRHWVEQSSDVSVLVNRSGNVKYISPSVLKVLGYSPTRSSHLSLSTWIHPSNRAVLLDLLSHPIQKTTTFYSRFRHQKGHWVPCIVSMNHVSPVALHGEADAIFFLSLRPINDAIAREILEETKKLQDQHLSKNGPEKSRWLAVMSHELRTPLNAIHGFAQILLQQKRSPLSVEQADMVQRILNNGKNLLSLINNILTLSKLEANQMRLHLEDINISDLIQETCQELSSLAAQKNLIVNIDNQLSDPVIVNDSLRLRQILVNLLANAIHASQDNEVWVVVESEEPSQLQISVRDAGPGIAPNNIKEIFNEFRQIEHPSGRAQAGTGLGLAICQDLATLMQGTLQLHSQLGAGSTFQLVIPRKAVNSHPQLPIH